MTILKKIETIENIFHSFFEELSLSEKFKHKSIKFFLKQLAFEEVKEAMKLACKKINHPEEATKYFCGICWTLIKAEHNNTQRRTK